MSDLKKQVHITILWGLPRSGKTTFANSLLNYNIINIDEIWHANLFLDRNQIFDKIGIEIDHQFPGKSAHFVLDGLITTNEQALALTTQLKSILKKYEIIFHLAWWKEDRQACLMNEVLATVAEHKPSSNIRNQIFEEPNQSLFDFNTITNLETPHLTGSFRYFKKYIPNLTSEMKLKSMEWLGYSFSAHEEEVNSFSFKTRPFHELENLLHIICPKLSLVDYKELYENCCEISGRVEELDNSKKIHHFYICDLEKLYMKLMIRKLISL